VEDSVSDQAHPGKTKETEMADTNPQGSASMSVNEAAGAFLGLMEPKEAEQAAPETSEQEERVEASEPEEHETQEQEAAPEPQRFRVKAAGEEREVTFDELVDGYQKGLDYTKKNQFVAEQRKAVEADRIAIEEAKRLRDAYSQRLGLIEQFLEKQNEGEDLSALKDVDPLGFAVKVAERTERDKQLAMLRAEQQRIAQQQTAEQQALLQKHIHAEAQRLAEFIPEYGDEKKSNEVKQTIRSLAKEIGYSDWELAQAYDHRLVRALWMAAQLVALQKQRPELTKKVQDAPKMLRPGVAANQKNAADENVKKAHSQLRKSGKISDAAALFERML
jgi:type IV pilus biogenesis protein CpaD/CtpE